jgi:hypothetical protein
MADPIGNYLAGLGFMGGPEVNPKSLTPEQLAQLGLNKFLPTPGLSFEVGPQMERTMEGLENMSNLGQYGIPQTQNSAGIPYDPAPVVKAVADLATHGYMNAPKSSAGVFGGMLTKDTGAQDRMIAGEAMRSQRAYPTDVWDATRTWAGPEGQPRYEIPDTGSSLTNSAFRAAQNAGPAGKVIAPLGEILNHPAAYEAYPGLPDMQTAISLNPINQGGYFVHFAQPGETQISAASNAVGGPEGLHGILLHEINHGIQGIEGFPSGSSTEAARQHAADFVNRLNKQLSDLGKDHWMLTREENPLDAPDMTRIAAQIERLKGMRDQFTSNFDPFQYYRRSAGEVESRGVQARMMMPPNELNAVPPEYMMGRDVPVPQRWISYANR